MSVWYYSPGEMKAKGERAVGTALFTANAVAIMAKAVPYKDRIISDSQTFDIFLSYRNADAEYALGIYLDLTGRGFRVYLDKVADAHLDRSKVTRETATVLRKRLMQSKSLFYVVSERSDDSKWMPWELGFQDGYSAKSAVLPVSDKNRGNFQGVEFVALYPKVKPSDRYLFIDTADESGSLITFEAWRDSTPARACGMRTCPLPKK